MGTHHTPGCRCRRCCATVPVVEHLATSDVPITVIYGDRDMVPTVLSARVADQAHSLVERVVIAGADHNDAVMFGPLVADAVTAGAGHR